MAFTRFNVGVLVLLAMLVSFSGLVWAQVSGATLSGAVTDASGSTVPNATILIKNSATGVTRSVQTDTGGFYIAPNLQPENYEVTCSASGFTTQVKRGVTLTVGGQQVLNFSLQVGQVSQSVIVTTATPLVELTSSALGSEVNSTTVRELPLNGRDWTSLAVLQPGVIGIRTQIGTTGSVNRGNRGFGNQLSISGHRPTENNYRVNGITVNDYSNGSPGSVQGAQLGVDAIQEFSVLTANYEAEYGRTAGGVINAITRAGTNNLHGSAYWFLRDEGLDARNYFDPKHIAPFHRNQFGASAGGPIQKDKTFIFADYEGIRQTKGLTGNSVVPSDAARGIGPDGAPTVARLCRVLVPNTPCVPNSPLPLTGPGAAPNPDPVTHIDKSVLPYLAFFPKAQGSIGNGDTGHFFAAIPQTYIENYVTARADRHLSGKDDADAVFFRDYSTQSTPDAFLLSTSQTVSTRWMGGMEETHSFTAALVNIARMGFDRTVGNVGKAGASLNPLAGDTKFGTGVVPNRYAPIIAGLGSVSTMQGSLGNQSTFDHVQNSYQFYDDAFLTHGANTFKFGVSVERLQNNTLSVTRPDGTFGFGGLESFLTNHPKNFVIGDPRVHAEVAVGTTFLGAYFQDNWRFRPNLTLNLGMRYELATLPTNAHIPFSVVQGLSSPPVNVTHPWQTNPTVRDFEPRLGFAWDPTGSGKQSVRAGFGIFDVLPGPWIIGNQESVSYPFALTKGTGGLPAGAFPNLNGISLGAGSAVAYAPDQNPKRNYAMNWNLTLQRQLTQSLAATVGYVGSHTLHSPFTTDDSNMVGPPQVTQTSVGTLWPCGPDGNGDPCAIGFLPNGQPSTLFNNHIGQLRPTRWDSNAHYNGLQAQLVQSMSHGLQAQASYTWSKCIDDGSNGEIGDPYANSLSSLIFFAPGSRHGLCDFNVGQNFVGNLIWKVPSPKYSSWALSSLTGGWELGGILTTSTGTPFTLLMGGDPLGQGSTDPFDYPSRLGNCNAINSNWKKNGLQYVNTNCFTPAIAPTSMAKECAPFVGAASAAPSGTVYCANLLGNAGRNRLIGPGVVDVDFAMYKNNYVPRISDSFNIQFRAEMFNVLNHANFQSPLCGGCQTMFNEDGSPSGGGFLSATSTEARQIQLSLKAIW